MSFFILCSAFSIPSLHLKSSSIFLKISFGLIHSNVFYFHTFSLQECPFLHLFRYVYDKCCTKVVENMSFKHTPFQDVNFYTCFASHLWLICLSYIYMPQSPLPQNPPIMGLYSFCLAFTFSFTITFGFEFFFEITKKKIHVNVNECCWVFAFKRNLWCQFYYFFFFLTIFWV